MPGEKDYFENLKVNLETTTRCGGSCMGCLLGSDDRTGGRLWNAATLARIAPFVRSFVDRHLENMKALEVSFNCGQGDHLLSPPEELAALVRWISDVSERRAVGFMTASAVGKPDRVRRAVDAVKDASVAAGQPMWFDVVLDPVKTTLPQFADVYAGNIDYIRRAFGGFDLNVNVGPDTVGTVRPSDVHAFLYDNAVARFTLNLTPTPGSAAAFAASWDSVVAWIGEFLDGWDPDRGTEFNIGQDLSLAYLYDGGNDQDDVAVMVERSAHRQIHIDGNGWISHTQAGFGDAPFSERIGWKPTHRATGEDGSDGYEVAGRSARRFAAKIMGMFRSHPICADCEFAKVCPRIGAGVARTALGAVLPTRVSAECPSGLKPVLRRLSASSPARIDSMLCSKTYTFVPDVFPSDIRENVRPMQRRNLPMMDFAGLRGEGA